MRRLRARLRGATARTAMWMFLAQLLQFGIQALYFVFVARALGVEQYGLFGAAAAVATTLAPFGMAGMATLVMRSIARDPAHARVAWGSALLTVGLLGTLVSAVVTVIALIVLPAGIGWMAIAAIALAEVVFANLHQVTSQLLLSLGDGRRSARMQVALSVVRAAAAALMFVAVRDASAGSWSALYLGSTMLVTAYGIVVVWRTIGRPRTDIARIRSELPTGMLYSIGFASSVLHSDADKPIVARLDGAAVAGVYTAGYRVVRIAMSPVTAVLQASYAQFFRHGAQGVIATTAYAMRLLPIAIVCGIASGLALLLGAPLAPHVFGSEFADVADVMRLLAPLPLIKAVQSLLADALTGADHQRARSVAQLVAAGCNIVATLALVSIWSYRGAIVATLATEVLLTVAIAIILRVTLQRARRAEVANA